MLERPRQTIKHHEQQRYRPVRDVGGRDQRFKLIAGKKEKRNRDIKVINPPKQAPLKIQGKDRGEQDYDSGFEGLRSAAPVKKWIDQLGNHSTQALSMWPMLPTEDLPKRMLFKQCCPVKVPLICDEKIYRVLRDKSKKFDADCCIAGQNQKQGKQIRPG